MAKQYAVARHTWSGFGDHISCLVGSWYFAKRTGRTLVIDWRGSRFNDDPTMRQNAFARWFQPIDDADGVPVITVANDQPIEVEGPIWPPKWSADDIQESKTLRHTAEEVLETAAVIRAEKEPVEQVAVFDAGLLPWPPREACAAFFQHLRFAPSIEAAAAEFKREKLQGATSIAIHIRHGNGENLGWRAAYWLTPAALARQLYRNLRNVMHGGEVRGRFHDNMAESLVGSPGQRGAERRFLRRIAREVNKLRRQPDLADAKPLLFTDAPHIFDLLKKELPDLVAFDAELREPQGGPLHQVKPTLVEGRENAMVGEIMDPDTTSQMMLELAVMRASSGIVCMDSGFSVIVRSEMPPEKVVELQPTWINNLLVKLHYKL